MTEEWIGRTETTEDTITARTVARRCRPEAFLPMPNFVYIIGCDQITYCGWTTDLEKRLQAHNDGTGARFTRGRTWKLLYAERLKSRSEAMSREWHLKRDRKFRQLLRA